MKKCVPIAKLVMLSSVIAVLCYPAVASDQASDDARTYQTELQAVRGQLFPIVEKKLTDWNFELGDIWQAENPTAKAIAKHNQGKTKFSKKELHRIFWSAGKFKVEIFGKLLTTTSVMVGTIASYGMKAGKRTTVNLPIYTVIRVVFKDDKLIDVRTWPKMEESDYRGEIIGDPMIHFYPLAASESSSSRKGANPD